MSLSVNGENMIKESIKISWNTYYKPENIFLIFAIIFGVSLVIITPPFQVPDETLHFRTSYRFSNFGDNYIPQSLVTTANAFQNIPFHRERKTSVEQILSFINIPLDRDNKTHFQVDLYSPIPYIPQIIGISIGKIFDLSPLILMYFGRIANLVVWIFLIYMAIRISPIAKWLFFLLALTPMSLFQAASLSPDAITNGTSLLIISLVLYYSLDGKKQRINRYDILAIILLSSILSLSKQVYIIIPLLFILIPIKKFNSKKEYISVMAIMLFLMISLNVLWYLHVSGQVIDRSPSDVSISKIFYYIISDPLNYVSILINTIGALQQSYINSFIGVLGWLDTPLPGYVYNSYIPMLLFAIILDKRNDITIGRKMKCIFGMAFCSIFILIMVSMYMTFTKIGDELIRGTQGRYFIPISPLLFILLYNNRKILNDSLKKKLPLFIIGYSSIILLVAIYYIIQRYYI